MNALKLTGRGPKEKVRAIVRRCFVKPKNVAPKKRNQLEGNPSNYTLRV